VPVCRLAGSAEELERHFAIRREVFVAEQALFAGDDRDAFDDRPDTLHAVGVVAARLVGPAEGSVAAAPVVRVRSAPARVGGAVRLYALDRRGLWRGDRLAVLAPLRRGLLGAALVRFAVRTAGERGGRRMIAMIQVLNVRFFEELGWRRAGTVEDYHGVRHQPMEIGLHAPVSRPAR
jgi:putative N-acetyltransferase (TIGR04045 family)